MDITPNQQETLDLAGNRWITVAKIAFTVLLLAALFATTDVTSLAARLLKVEPGYVAAAILVGMVQIVLAALRLRIIGHTTRPAVAGSVRRFIEITWVTTFASQVAPTIAGDALRVLLLRVESGSLRGAFKSVVVDRGFGVALLLFLSLIACLTAPPLLADKPYFATILWIIVGAMVALFLLLALSPRLQVFGTYARVVAALIEALLDMRRILSSPTTGFAVVALSLAIHGLSMVAFGLLASGEGVPLRVIEIFAIVSLMSFSAMIPATLAGWGIREGMVMGLFASTHTSPEAALLLSLSFGTVILLAALPGALLLLPIRSTISRERKLDQAAPK